MLGERYILSVNMMFNEKDLIFVVWGILVNYLFYNGICVMDLKLGICLYVKFIFI